MLQESPTDEQVQAIEDKVNEIIDLNMPVTDELVNIDVAKDIVDLSKLPDDVSDTLRIVRVGDYDVCACIGLHVENTSQIGVFKITTHSFDNGKWRVRFKLNENK